MPYRKFDTGTWQDPWFEDLPVNAKLAFVYFWTNEICNQAGIYEISEKRFLFDLGYGIDTISSVLNPKIIWYPDKKIVWVRNFFKRQCQNGKFAISAMNSIKSDPFKLQLFIDYNRKILQGLKIDLSSYHIDMVSIPYPTEQNRTVQYRAVQNSTEQIKKTPAPEIEKFEPLPKKNNNPETSSGLFLKNNKVKNPDFSVNLTDVFMKINNHCEKIKALPKNSERKKTFNPMAWAQKKINIKKHPGAIEKTLDGLSIYWDRSRDPWAYADTILSKLNGTYNEQESIMIHEDLKKSYNNNQLVELTAGLIKEV